LVAILTGSHYRSQLSKSRRSVEVDKMEDKQEEKEKKYIMEDRQRFEASMAILHQMGQEMEGRPAKIKMQLDPLFLGLFKK
jgi:predicted  nucleic acid-binding Zn-ribbon protein